MVTGHNQSNIFFLLQSWCNAVWLPEITPDIFYEKPKSDYAENSEVDFKV